MFGAIKNTIDYEINQKWPAAKLCLFVSMYRVRYYTPNCTPYSDLDLNYAKRWTHMSIAVRTYTL